MIGSFLVGAALVVETVVAVLIRWHPDLEEHGCV